VGQSSPGVGHMVVDETIAGVKVSSGHNNFFIWKDNTVRLKEVIWRFGVDGGPELRCKIKLLILESAQHDERISPNKRAVTKMTIDCFFKRIY
jgi:hypothetical protein